MKVTIEVNSWKLPGPPTYFEGKPEPDELERDRAEAEAARKIWTPGPDAWALLDRLRPFVGREVIIQGWDPLMFFFEDEGPTPIRATCVDVITREVGGHIRAYLSVTNPTAASPSGGDVRFQLEQDGASWLYGIDDLYEIKTAVGAN